MIKNAKKVRENSKERVIIWKEGVVGANLKSISEERLGQTGSIFLMKDIKMDVSVR